MTSSVVPQEVAARIVRAYLVAMDYPSFIRRKRVLAWAGRAGFSQENADLVPDLYALLSQNPVQRNHWILQAIEEYVSPDGHGGYVPHTVSPRNTLYVYSPEKYALPNVPRISDDALSEGA